jgi:ferredoxin
MGEAEHRQRDPDLGPGHLHPVQQVRPGVPARGDPRQGRRSGEACGRPRGVQERALQGRRVQGPGLHLQVAPEDCTGCNLCVEVCPAKDKSNPKHKSLDMTLQRPIREAERARYAFFLSLPEVDRAAVKADVKGSQFLRPLFEYSGACAGCGETPYVKLMTQTLRRPPPGRQRPRLLLDLRRQPPHDARTARTSTAGVRPGPTRCSRTNAEFAFGFRLAVDRAAGPGEVPAPAARRPARRRPDRRAVERRPDHGGGHP